MMPLLMLIALLTAGLNSHALAPRQLRFTVGQRTFDLSEPAADSKERRQYESMSPEEKISFQRKRVALLKISARALKSLRYGFGIGAVVGGRVRYAVRRLRRGQAPDAQLEQAQANLSEHSEEMVQLLLELIDQTIWTDAPLFSRSNEYGVVGAIGGQYIQKKFDDHRGGLVDLGFTLAFNREENSLAFQIFFEREVLESSLLPALLLTGFNLKAGLYIANHKTGEFKHEGRAIYAPPGAPTFMTHSPRDAMAGFSSGGFLTFPPSPIGDLVTNINAVDRTYVYRGTISPYTPGFIRIHKGALPDTFRVWVEPVRRSAQRIFSWIAQRASDCRALLTAKQGPDPEDPSDPTE